MLTSFNSDAMQVADQKMVVEIWSDVVCPFCYIGKRRFENALSESGLDKNVEIVWKSFQLNPSQKTNPLISVTQDLANQKGWTLDYTRQMSNHVSQMASGENLTYDFDKAVVANSFRAHRVLQFAKQNGHGNKMKENLLAAYFTQGKNIDDAETLAQLAKDSGLDYNQAFDVANDEILFAEQVNNDITEASQLGISGVPFFVFDRKYAISGAQETDVFINTLKKAVSEWKSKQTVKLEVTEGAVCKPNEACD